MDSKTPDVRSLAVLSTVYARPLEAMTPAPSMVIQALAHLAAAVATLVEVALLLHSAMAQHHHLFPLVRKAISQVFEGVDHVRQSSVIEV